MQPTSDKLTGWYLAALYILFIPFSIMLAILAGNWWELLMRGGTNPLSVYALWAIAGTTVLLNSRALWHLWFAMKATPPQIRPDLPALGAIFLTAVAGWQLFAGV